MKRRGILAGLGVAISGVSLAGTGAFTQVSGERTADIAVVREDEASLRLEELDVVEYPNAGLASNTGGGATLELDLNQELEGDGFGPNTDAVSTFDDVFAVTNTGSQDVFFWAEFPEAPVYDEIGLYVDDPDELLDGEEATAELPVGERVLIGVMVDADQIVDNEDEMVEMTIRADEADPTADNGP